MIASQDTFKLQYNQQPKILNAYNLSRGAIAVYSYLYSLFRNSDTLVSDHKGQHLTVKRTTISEQIGSCVKTVIKYVKELVAHNLIEDVRMGYKQINKIYFIDVDDKFKYDKNYTDTNDDTINETETSTNEVTGLINQVKEIISPIENITTKEAKRLLAVSNSDTDAIKKASDYTSSQSYNNFMDYLCKVIKNKWYIEKPKNETTQPSTNRKPYHKHKKTVNKFNLVESRNYDMDKLEKTDRLYHLNSIGEIDDVELNNRLKDLE